MDGSGGLVLASISRRGYSCEAPSGLEACWGGGPIFQLENIFIWLALLVFLGVFFGLLSRPRLSILDFFP